MYYVFYIIYFYFNSPFTSYYSYHIPHQISIAISTIITQQYNSIINPNGHLVLLKVTPTTYSNLDDDTFEEALR